LIENWCHEKRSKAYFKSESVELKSDHENETVTGFEELNQESIDSLIEKSWIYGYKSHIYKLIELIETDKLNGSLSPYCYFFFS